MPHLDDLRHREALARCLLAAGIAIVGEAGELVDGAEMVDAIRQPPAHESRVVGKGSGGVARLPPSPPVFQRLGQVPVKQRQVRSDASRRQLIDHALVKRDALLIGLSRAIRKHARPRHGHPVRLHAQPLQELDVFPVAMIRVIRHVAGVAVGYFARRLRERVPDGRLSAVFGGPAFHLIGRGGATPQKAVGEAPGVAPGIPVLLRTRGLHRAREGGGAERRNAGTSAEIAPGEFCGHVTLLAYTVPVGRAAAPRGDYRFCFWSSRNFLRSRSMPSVEVNITVVNRGVRLSRGSAWSPRDFVIWCTWRMASS